MNKPFACLLALLAIVPVLAAPRRMDVSNGPSIFAIEAERETHVLQAQIEATSGKRGIQVPASGPKEFSVEKPECRGPRLFFAGDSTLDDGGLSLGGEARYPYASWGTALQASMRAGCCVVNYAKSGASTKSFSASGAWQKLIVEVRAGDFVAIQFGHNDQKRHTEFYLKNRWTDPKGLFREIVRQWVKEIREKGATPLLVSPICRCTFDKRGKKLLDSKQGPDGICLQSYRDAAKELSEELGCDFIDMNGLTRELMERLGRDEAMKFFVVSTGYRKSKDGEPSKDTTHPCRAGAEAFSKLFIANVKSRKLTVAELFREEFRPYRPLKCGVFPPCLKGKTANDEDVHQ